MAGTQMSGFVGTGNETLKQILNARNRNYDLVQDGPEVKKFKSHVCDQFIKTSASHE